MPVVTRLLLDCGPDPLQPRPFLRVLVLGRDCLLTRRRGGGRGEVFAGGWCRESEVTRGGVERTGEVRVGRGWDETEGRSEEDA